MVVRHSQLVLAEVTCKEVVTVLLDQFMVYLLTISLKQTLLLLMEDALLSTCVKIKTFSGLSEVVEVVLLVLLLVLFIKLITLLLVIFSIRWDIKEILLFVWMPV